jgi:hypothetical protein
MLSYQWHAQATIHRVNESLMARGYLTWFDLNNMKGAKLSYASLGLFLCDRAYR